MTVRNVGLMKASGWWLAYISPPLPSEGIGDPVSNRSVTEVIETTCLARNTLAHNVAWSAPSLTSQKYALLAETISAAVLHAISSLYP